MGIYVEIIVGVNDQKAGTSNRVYQTAAVALPQYMQEGRFIEIGKSGQVLTSIQ